MRLKYLAIIPIVAFGILWAVPASPEPQTILYPDGRSITVYLRGDENISWHETEDGLHVKKNKYGQYEYISTYDNNKAVLSGVVAHDPQLRDFNESKKIQDFQKYESSPIKPAQFKRGLDPLVPTSQTLGKSLAPSDDPFEHTDFPTLGSRKFLCILVDFSDKSLTHSNAKFDSLFNAKDYTYDGAYGSVNEYYKTTSFDLFDPTFDIVGPVTLDSSWSYYGRDENGNNDVNIQNFTYEALHKADSIVDYSDYDLDNDGYVDNVYFIYAGYGQASGADDNTIWPHRWYLYSMGNERLDGKYFGDYSTSNELYGTYGTKLTSIGVICHEFGHVCGLPDFYDTDYSGSGGNTGGLGAWDEMAGGSWNDAGRRPPMFNAWSRMYLNWAVPVELTSVESVHLDPAYTSNQIRYFRSQTDGEIFMMENRQQVGYDAAIPGHGLLIFHIDMNSSRWYNNSLNNNPDRQAFDLEEADGFGNRSSSYINAGDAFPGTSHNTSFTDLTNPNALDWAGNNSRSPLRNIMENSGVISFMFGDAHIEGPTNVALSTQGYDSVTVTWTLNHNADSIMILWAEDKNIGFPENMQKYDVGEDVNGAHVVYKGIDTVFYHVGLRPGTINNYAIFAFNDSAYIYSDKISESITINSPPFYSTDFSNGLPQGWTIFDRYGNGTFTEENPLGRSIGSTTNGNGFMVMDSEHFGEVSQIDAELITQSFNFKLSHSVVLRFQHRLEVKSLTLARILYTVNNGSVWYEAARWTANTDNPDLVELDLTAEVAGFRDVKFKFNYRGTNEKYWCIDDFEISSALDSGLSASFFATTLSGAKPLKVKFYNSSVSSPDTIDSYIWELDNSGEFYYEKEPEITYARSGKYTITLSTQQGEDISNFMKTDYITVTNDAPQVINEDYDTLDVRKNMSVAYNMKHMFMDPNDDLMHYSWSGNSDNLVIAVEEDSMLIFTPENDFLGVETITLTAYDNENDSITHQVVVWVSETGVSDMLPTEFKCAQNYPNPFNPTTAIMYQLPSNELVDLSIYNLTGHKIKTLVSGMQDAGYYSVNFHAGDLPSGMYLYRLIAGNEVITKKMVLMK
jgi:M6 family metalloprotease-like protein